MSIYHCVINGDGTALAVYGEALLDMAKDLHISLQKQFPGCGIGIAQVSRSIADRPHVGDAIKEQAWPCEQRGAES